MEAEQRFLEPHERGRAWSWSRSRERDGETQDTTPPPPRELPDERDAAVYVISVAAELAGLHPQTLRAYEREGLLSPSRTEGGTRRYSRRDVERLQFIRRLTQDEGLNLAGVRIVLELGEKLEDSRRRVGELEEMVRVLAERIDDRPREDRFEIVKAPPSQMEVHSLRRRTGASRSGARRARPVQPPERRAADG